MGGIDLSLSIGNVVRFLGRDGGDGVPCYRQTKALVPFMSAWLFQSCRGASLDFLAKCSCASGSDGRLGIGCWDSVPRRHQGQGFLVALRCKWGAPIPSCRRPPFRGKKRLISAPRDRIWYHCHFGIFPRNMVGGWYWCITQHHHKVQACWNCAEKDHITCLLLRWSLQLQDQSVFRIVTLFFSPPRIHIGNFECCHAGREDDRVDMAPNLTSSMQLIVFLVFLVWDGDRAAS
ncbi:hypothetical protein B0T19DRAFT_230360 [Cercophora scortea]|uniref:Uncharacterized protein n=1 Tax=Cercophora scortea TaxID=314031 RepID=A0AAE0IHG9_9PEZI|nr:hypothetical protein B0T19DRAFT_230360 [Cercophora scortea]